MRQFDWPICKSTNAMSAFLNRQNNNKNKPKYILLIVLTKMDKIGVNQKKSNYFGTVTTFDFGVNMGQPRRFGCVF